MTTETDNQELFESAAKHVADLVAGYDTASDEWQHVYSKPNGIIFMRMAHNKRTLAFKHLDDHMKRITFKNPAMPAMIEADKECFYDHVLSHLCGGGCEVEWEEE